MNIALWIVQIILGLAFMMFGAMKTFQYEKAKAGMPWVKEYSKGLVLFIGASELLGGIGLIVPYATEIVPELTPIAAVGLAVIMFFAAVFHARRKEYQAIGMNILLIALTVFVAVGRF
ncbi:DoxX family protein [Cohnella sp. WQ 127256]|uniref:DoxX family protein n=1 Tax=Cohnella sp. WQ 127256 TaxID=2938790 RepID=UPI00211771B4